jgi:uncharacterized protein
MDNACNLHCRYCSIQPQFKNFRLEDGQLPAWKWFPRLLEEMSRDGELRAVTFGWHGGEPLLLPQELLEMAAREQSHYLTDISYLNFIQTNGLLLDEWADFLYRIGFDITVSIDGPEYKHNQFRCKHVNSFEKILSNIYSIKKKKLPYALCMVIHENNCLDAQIIMNFLLEMNPKNGVTFPPLFNDASSIVDPSKFGDFLVAIFDLWWPECLVRIGLFESIIAGLEGKVPNICFLCGKCQSFLSIDSQGNMYSTCWLIGDYTRVGNILEDSLEIIMSNHARKIQELTQKEKKRSLFQLLGSDITYIYFQSTGCVYRAAVEGRKDPYQETYARLIQHIEKRVFELE